MKRLCNLCAVLLLCSVLCGLISCQPSMGSSGLVIPAELAPAALPFVEAVHFPAEIHANQPFSITVDLSSALNPDALRTPLRDETNIHWTARLNVVEDGEIVWKYYATFWPQQLHSLVDLSLPARTRVTYTFDEYPLPAGMHTLQYYSAPSREQGGMTIQVEAQNLSPRGGDELPDIVESLEFNVLP